MTRLTRASGLALAALAALMLTLSAPLAGALAATAAQFTKESKQAYERQLSKGEIKQGTFNKKLRNLHIETRSGQLFLYHYGKKESKKLAAELEKKHARVTFLTPSQASKEAKAKPAKHKLRYIAGGILVAVVVIVGIVLLVNRRRARDE
ncbi:MAG TPA: hypothetical protein VGD00_09365 [Solirubrobacteraceae bacterium]|jgi:hypothetical protein